MAVFSIFGIINIFVVLFFLISLGYLIILSIKALKIYIRNNDLNDYNNINE